MSKRQFRPILIKDMELSVNVVLYQQQDFLGHLLAVAVNQLNAVIIVGIVAGGDHNATVEVIYTSDVRHRRGRGDMEQIGIRTRSSQPSDKAVLKHIGAAASVFANDNASRVGITIAFTQCVIIPAQEAANLIGVIRC